MATEVAIESYLLSDDPARLDFAAICGFLGRSYWGSHRSEELIRRSIEGSRAFGLYDGSRQIGFARLVTDGATVYYLCDVFVDEEYRGSGVGKAFVDALLNLSDLDGQVGILATRDAHGLYEKYGFVLEPEHFMRRPGFPR